MISAWASQRNGSHGGFNSSAGSDFWQSHTKSFVKVVHLSRWHLSTLVLWGKE